MIELAGAEDKIEALIDLLKPYGVVELARTGVIAMPRGRNTGRSNPRYARNTNEDTASGGPTVDPGDLPPG